MAETYTLPDLPSDPGALEPHISGRIMELRHGKHHATIPLCTGGLGTHGRTADPYESARRTELVGYP